MFKNTLPKIATGMVPATDGGLPKSRLFIASADRPAEILKAGQMLAFFWP